MKKQLLFAAAVVLGAGVYAQTARKAAVNKPIKASAEAVIAEKAFPTGVKAQQGPTPPPQTNAVCNPIRFTSCINAFAVGGGVTTYQQNCLSYQKDLNQVTWTSRVSQDWSFAGKTSGAIQSTWLDVSTGAWDSLILYRDSANGNAARYPGGLMFNPTGNTAVAGSQLIGSGSVTGGSGWLGAWYANRQPSGNYQDPLIPNVVNFSAVGTAPFGNAGNSFTNCGFVNLDMQQIGSSNTVVVGSSLFDYTQNTESKGGILAKATYSGGSFTWSADSIVPGFLSTALGLMTDGLGGRIAFSPDGQTGYVVFNGRLSTNYNNNADSSMMPIVYKSTDAGATWNMVLAGYDWEVQHPEILKNVGVLQGITDPHPTINYQHGTDLTVDKNGVLHYVTTITLPYQNGRYVGGGHDSLQYTYTYKWDYANNHPIIWDLMTDGNCWKTMMVDSIITAYVGGDPNSDTTASFNAWDNSGTYMPYGAHLTVSRASDGSAVFYGWGDSDPNVTGTPFNSQPDIIMKGFDVNTNMVSATSNITNGVGTCYFSYLSDNSYYDNTAGNWVVPFVYTVGRSQISPGVFNGLAAVDYYYGNCATYNSANMNIPAVINNETNPPTAGCTIGIANSNAYTVKVGNYPNPFSHSTNIVVSINDAMPLQMNVYNSIGVLVSSKKMNGNPGENTFVFDGSSLSAGVYHYTITAGSEKITRKMVLQK